MINAISMIVMGSGGQVSKSGEKSLSEEISVELRSP